MYSRSLLSQLLLALFFLGTSSASAVSLDKALQIADTNKLFENKGWQSLLHLKNNQPQITDPKFLLSVNEFSLKLELTKTIELFYQKPDSSACRFPARLLFLQQYIRFDKALDIALLNCTEYKKFKDYVPFDQLSLVFASEVLSSASSMMGHTFLKASGTNLNNSHVAHSIAFFTEIKTFNPLKLIYDGMFSGMDGFIIVKQFDEDLKRYIDVEGRNIWSYSLDLSPTNKALIQAHIWELKNIEITYLFQNYNCATLTLYLLSIAKDELRQSEKLYVSPLDVAKAVNEHQMVIAREVLLATDWELNMLEQEMSSSLLNQVKYMIYEDIPLQVELLSQKSKFLIKRFLLLILQKEELLNQLGLSKKLEIIELVEQLKPLDFNLDLSQYKNPIHAPQDSIISGSILEQDNNTMLEMSFLPASHYLYGNNEQYFSESELRIGELTVRVDLEEENFGIQSLTLYSVKSYVPSSTIESSFSGGFYLGYHHLFDQNLLEQGVFELSGDIGRSYKVHKDVLLYGMLGLGVAINEKDRFAFVEPYVGASINLIGDSKAIVEYKLSHGQFDISGAKESVSLDFAWFGLRGATLKLGWKSKAISNARVNQVSLTWDHHF